MPASVTRFGKVTESFQICCRFPTTSSPFPLTFDCGGESKFEDRVKGPICIFQDRAEDAIELLLIHRGEWQAAGQVDVTEVIDREGHTVHAQVPLEQPAVDVLLILINVAGDARGINAGVDDDAKARAEQVRARILRGEAFEQLAASVSDAPSKANGGLIGPINATDLSPDFRKIVDGLKPGELTPVIRTPRGYQILKLESATPTKVTEFEKARDQISDRVFTDKRRDEFQKYLVKLRAQAIIDWRNRDIKKAYEEGVVQQAKGAAVPGQ